MEIPYSISARPDTGLYNAKIAMWLFLASEVMLFGGLFSAYVFLRVGSSYWPHGYLNVTLGTINTMLLIGSSITNVLAWAALKMREFQKFKLLMGVTILLGLIFLGIKAKEYHDKFNHYGVFKKDGTVLTGHLQSTPEADPVVLLADPVPFGTSEYDRATPEQLKAEDKVVSIAQAQIERISNWTPKYSTFFAIYFTMTGLHALHILGGLCVFAFFWLTGHNLYRRNPEQLANRVEVAGLFWCFVDLVWIFLFPVLYLL